MQYLKTVKELQREIHRHQQNQKVLIDRFVHFELPMIIDVELEEIQESLFWNTMKISSKLEQIAKIEAREI